MADAGRTPTNLRMLAILEALADAGAPLSPAEITRRVGLPKPSVHRLCATLEAEGHLVRAEDGRSLRPGRRLRRIAGGLAALSQDHVARRQVLAALARAFKETVNLAAPGDGGMRYLDRVETEWPLRVALPVGSHVPFHCTASGKCFLAGLRSAARKAMLESLELEPLTPATITDPELLEAELAQVRRRGYATDRGEFIEGLNAVAFPVRAPSGGFLAAVALHGPAERVDVDAVLSRRAEFDAAVERLRALML